MSGSAVLSATIDEMTSSTPSKVTVSNQTRARAEAPVIRASARSSCWVRVSITRRSLRRVRLPFETDRLQQRLTVSFAAGEVVDNGRRAYRPTTCTVSGTFARSCDDAAVLRWAQRGDR